MNKNIIILLCLLLSACSVSRNTVRQPGFYQEEHRPQFHFSPQAKWMNDPNGLVFIDGEYHLFFQHYPESNVWGPMHWGHAISRDLIHWEQQPIALYPDSLGWIFSGSVVYDEHNTSGLGHKNKGPLVAIFTHHNSKLQNEGRKDFEYQSLAFSTDRGKTWQKYTGNPVLKNPGIADFRDPKVHWNEQVKKWILTLATHDRVTFYSSINLINWTKEGEFGEKTGEHGSVWECPDLFPLKHEGKTVWVLLVSVGNGAPNGGSGTQYFLGDFDGKTFRPYENSSKWLEYGKDNYAGVTFSNTDRSIFMGWMSNLQYAQKVPTEVWRSAMTFARELSLKSVNGTLFLASNPVKELSKLKGGEDIRHHIPVKGNLDLSAQIEGYNSQLQLKLSTDQMEDFQIVLSNELGEKLTIGFDKAKHQYYVDRKNAGKHAFDTGFAAKSTAPRISKSEAGNLNVLIDLASAELFADQGLTVMTTTFFPHQPFNKLKIVSENGIILSRLEISSLESIWK